MKFTPFFYWIDKENRIAVRGCGLAKNVSIGMCITNDVLSGFTSTLVVTEVGYHLPEQLQQLKALEVRMYGLNASWRSVKAYFHALQAESLKHVVDGKLAILEGHEAKLTELDDGLKSVVNARESNFYAMVAMHEIDASLLGSLEMVIPADKQTLYIPCEDMELRTVFLDLLSTGIDLEFIGDIVGV